MSEYRMLIINSNNAVTMDFFGHFKEKYDVLSCSAILDDIENHLRLLEPQVMLLPVSDDPDSEARSLTPLKRILAKNNIAFAVMGSDKGCSNFQKLSYGMADIEVIRPFHYDDIDKSIKSMIEEKKFLKKQLADSLDNNAAAPSMGGFNPSGGDAANISKRKCILVIDDDPLMLRVLKKYLSDTYDVATAVNAKAAYKYLEKNTADLILLDYQMPDENGPQTLTKIRENPDTAKIPVIFLTGVKERGKIAEVLALHPQGYMLKPVDREKLLGTLDSFFGG